MADEAKKMLGPSAALGGARRGDSDAAALGGDNSDAASHSTATWRR
jgi:hypothetical protein